MINDEGGLFTINFGHQMDDILGRFEVSNSPKAKTQWELFRNNPELFEFAVGYINKDDGSKELVEVSMIVNRPKDEQSNTN